MIRLLILTSVLTLSPGIVVRGQFRVRHRKDSVGMEMPLKEKIYKTTVIPSTLFSLGALAMLSESHTDLNKQSLQQEFLEHPHSSAFEIEDHLRNAPIVMVYALNIAGIKGKNNFGERSILLAKSLLIQHLIVSSLKNYVEMDRPDGGSHSFPSSHTARAFTAATFMHYEYGHLSPMYSVGAFGMATLTAYLRMEHNHHWVNDVLIGAGIGILSTNIAYLTHKYRLTEWQMKKGKGPSVALLPSVSSESAGLVIIILPK